MKNKDNHIDRLTPEIMDRYLRGDLNDREMNAVERLMLESDFDREAMEGAGSLSEGQMASDLSLLQKRLDDRVAPSRKNTWWLVAAVFALLITSGILLVEYTTPTAPQISESQAPVVNKEEEKENENENENENEDEDEDEDEDEEQTMEDVAPITEEPTIGLLSEAPLKKEQAPVRAETKIVEDDAIVNRDEAVVSSPEPLSGLAVDSIPDLSLPQIAINRREQQLYGTIKGEDLGPRTMSQGKKLDLLHGKVVNQTGTPIPGASITITGTDKETVTNQAGEFELTVGDVPGNKLKISRLGLMPQELLVPTQDSLTVVMSDETMSLDEVAGLASSVSASPSNGFVSFMEYLKANANNPVGNTEPGEVLVEFLVRASGDLEEFNILRTSGEEFSAEALRLIKEGPVWKPAYQNGKPIDERVKILVTFPADN